MKQNYEGSCHCGKVRFTTQLDPAEAIVCDCSICSKKGSIVVKVEEDDFQLMTPLDDLSEYRFNKKIARHYFCPTCGIHTFNRPRTTPELWAVNIRCLSDVDIASVKPRSVSGSKLD